MSRTRDDDVLSVTLHDTALHDELDLLVEMVVAASESTGPLTQNQIDRVLFASHIAQQRTAN